MIGFIAADIAFDDIPAIMQSYSLGSTGFSILATRSGDILYHPDKAKVLKEKNHRQSRRSRSYRQKND
ncbi:hypothetical protein ACFSQ7_28835 [Paenibacillus rhizoplanae]